MEIIGNGVSSLISNLSDVAASRAINTEYQNTSGEPKIVMTICQVASGGTLYAYCENASPPTEKVYQEVMSSGAANYLTAMFIVPSGWYYKVVGGIAILEWWET